MKHLNQLAQVKTLETTAINKKQIVTTTFNKYAFTIILSLSLSFQCATTICKLKSDLNKKILSKHVDINV